MNFRHSKVDVVSEVVQKGARCTSSTSSNNRTSSALQEPDRLKHSGSSFRSIRSAQFHEIEISETINDDDMKQKILPAESIELEKRGDAPESYDNPALDLSDEQGSDAKNSNKVSVSSTESAGLVMNGSRSRRKPDAEAAAQLMSKLVPEEAKKYTVDVGDDSGPIRVKSALASGAQNESSDDEDVGKLPPVKEHKENSKIETKGVSQDLQVKNDVDNDSSSLRRSKTVETNCSIPSTSYTYDSSQVPSTSFYGDSIRDETLRLGGESTDFGSSTISQESKPGKPAKQFEAPAGVSETSFKTYQNIQKDTFKSGRCVLMTMLVITFIVTMVLAVLILIMPHSFAEKKDGSLQHSTTPSPHMRSMKLGRSYAKNAGDQLQTIPNYTTPADKASL